MASIVAEKKWSGLSDWTPQSGNYRFHGAMIKTQNCIVDYKLPAVSPRTLLNQQTATLRNNRLRKYNNVIFLGFMSGLTTYSAFIRR